MDRQDISPGIAERYAEPSGMCMHMFGKLSLYDFSGFRGRTPGMPTARPSA
jgi:hypothetical protein